MSYYDTRMEIVKYKNINFFIYILDFNWSTRTMSELLEQSQSGGMVSDIYIFIYIGSRYKLQIFFLGGGLFKFS